MADGKQALKKNEKDVAKPRRANECFVRPHLYRHRFRLFDEFWREGELAILFGPQGVGKSVLAVQIADALARGRPLDGFCMPVGRSKVLYVDMVLSDAQFHARYSKPSERGRDAKPHKFSDNLYRARPETIDGFCEWLRSEVKANRFEAIVIDDLASLR